MRVAVVSDIHSNLPALEAALEAASPYDGLWILGDSVGYGPYPNEVIERLRHEDARAVQGNHDAAVLGRIPTSTFNGMARAAVAWTRGAIAKSNADWLASRGAALVVQDEEMGRQLLPTILGLLEDRERLDGMADRARALARPDAARRLAKELVAMATDGPGAA